MYSTLVRFHDLMCLKSFARGSRRARAAYAEIGPKALPMSASLIGRSGSSAFRLSTNSVSTPLAGSCFSSESAPRPFHHGIRRRGGTIFGAALPLDER